MVMHKVALVTLPKCRLKLDELCGHVAYRPPFWESIKAVS